MKTVEALMGWGQYVAMFSSLQQWNPAAGALDPIPAAAVSAVAVAGAIAAGAAAALLCAMVAHGILRPLLEARGVAPWAVRDTLGSIPLVLCGAALAAAAAVYLVCVLAFGLPLDVGGGVSSAGLGIRVLCLALLLSGLLMVRLGLLALRKLT